MIQKTKLFFIFDAENKLRKIDRDTYFGLISPERSFRVPETLPLENTFFKRLPRELMVHIQHYTVRWRSWCFLHCEFTIYIACLNPKTSMCFNDLRAMFSGVKGKPYHKLNCYLPQNKKLYANFNLQQMLPSDPLEEDFYIVDIGQYDTDTFIYQTTASRGLIVDSKGPWNGLRQYHYHWRILHRHLLDITNSNAKPICDMSALLEAWLWFDRYKPTFQRKNTTYSTHPETPKNISEIVDTLHVMYNP
jgi:hypothetical protein